MTSPLPRTTVPAKPAHWPADVAPHTWPWTDLAPLPPFQLADGSGSAQQQTSARLCHAAGVLHVHFDCTDRDIWGTLTARDAPIYDEEAVELFIAPGTTDPVDYFEFEVSPNGVLLDTTIHNPTGLRADMQADFAWDCPGIQWHAVRDDAANRWQAWLSVPLAPLVDGALPTQWRANLYRIERPRDGAAEFSCWSPTLAVPADFHKPARFGLFELEATKTQRGDSHAR
jgi:hypothetical protein